MSVARRLKLSSALLCATLFLAACDSPEERADAYYQSALAFIAEGDVDRAKIELRNVFENDRFHAEARRTFAEIALAEGNLGQAYQNYQFIVEETPDTADVRLVLSEIALDLGNYADAKRHGIEAIRMLPDEPRAQALKAAFDYEDGRLAENPEAVQAAVEAARALAAELPENTVVRRVIIDDLLRSDDPTSALPAVDEILRLDPNSYGYNQLKLRLLGESQDMAAIGNQLQSMVALFPEDQELAQTLIRWFLAEEDLDGAEAFLRQLAGEDTGDAPGHITVVQFLENTRGLDAAKAELERLAAANTDTENGNLYRALAAVIDFDQGQQDTAIATLEEITTTEANDAQTMRIRMILANIYQRIGNTVGARAQVETVLEADPSNVAALKARAGWAIRDDTPEAAIIDLRTALNQAPRDPEILTLLAQAHERDGAKALAGERLAQAVEVTNSRPDEALRYARFLLSEDRRAAAVNVLADARATSPANVQVLAALAEQLLLQQSWVQVERIVGDLDQIGSDEAVELASSLRAAILVGQGRVDDSLSFLQEQIARGDSSVRTVLQIIQLNVQSDNFEEARRVMDEALAADPENPTLQLTNTNLLLAEGNVDAGIAKLREIIAANPTAETPVRQLYTLLRRQGDAAGAADLLDAALGRLPDSAVLNWLRASELEQAGDIDGAIEVYEKLYAADSSNVLIANNLASLITSYRDDAESLDRAAAIARRLRDSDSPPLQDTYGWIAFRQGNVAEALPYLESAAAGLPNDPVVQVHYGLALAASENTAQAREVLRRALDLAGDTAQGAQFDEARQTLDALPAE